MKVYREDALFIALGFLGGIGLSVWLLWWRP